MPVVTPLLSLSGVETAYFGRLAVLRGVSLQVPQGGLVAVLGSNGAGKSTLLRTISGLIPNQPQKGEIRLAGLRINGLEPEQVARLGVAHVPEGRGLFPELTVAENLELGAWGVTSRREREAGFERVGTLFPVLRERQHQLAGTLSGGEQQMLAIARAVMRQPRLLMLDEPSVGLAPLVVREIFRVIAEVNRLGTTVLVVEQNARLALEVATYAYVLENGRIVLEGTGAELAQNPNVQELYLGVQAEPSVKGYRRYRKRRRWA